MLKKLSECEQLADGGDNFRIWTVAANIVSMQWRNSRQNLILQLGGWAKP
jgi:hypothetical protein